jgi:hypothetical protein
MQIEKALVQAMKDDATLAALLLRSGSEYHIYANAIPENYAVEQSDTACYVVYTRLGTRYNQLFGYQIASYQISIFTKKYAKAIQARDALFSMLQRFKGTLGSSGKTQLMRFVWLTNNLEMKDTESGDFHMILECSFKYSE